MREEEELDALLKELPPPVFLKEPWHSPWGRLLREIVLGASDGLVEGLGFVAGATASLVAGRLIVLAALAQSVAGAFSMGVGGYLSGRAERDFFRSEIRRELREMEEMPELEREEVRRIYAAKGFGGEELDRLVERLTSDRRIWLKVMLEEELGIFFDRHASPFSSAFLIGVSFGLGSLLNVIPYLFLPPLQALPVSLGLAGLGLFSLGALRTRLTGQSWWRAGLETALWGSMAALVGYALGRLASRLLPGVG